MYQYAPHSYSLVLKGCTSNNRRPAITKVVQNRIVACIRENTDLIPKMREAISADVLIRSAST